MSLAPPPPNWSGPQHVATVDRGHAAGFWIRFVAYIIDVLVLGIVVIVIFFVAALLAGFSMGVAGLGIILAIPALILTGWLYEALLTSGPHGATLGKRVVGLRIVRADGAQLSFGRATARYFLKAMITPLVPLAIGYLMAAFTSGKRSLHDFMADTLVIYRDRRLS